MIVAKGRATSTFWVNRGFLHRKHLLLLCTLLFVESTDIRSQWQKNRNCPE